MGHGADLLSESSTPSERRSVLGVSLHGIEPDDAVERVIDAARSEQPLGVSALAVHGVMTCVGDPEQQYRVNELELVVPDGQPVRWALRWLHGVRLSERVYGPDLMDDVCRRAAQEGLPIYLFGSSPETLGLLVPALKRRYPQIRIAGTQPSRFRSATAEEAQEDVERIRASGAKIVMVGLGCPRQEIWAYENRLALSLPVLAVGAAFDYLAGILTRPPGWVQRRGLEWFYRLVQEPRRLWRRYVLLNPAYLVLVGLQLLGVYELGPARAQRPESSRRPG